MAIVGDRGLSFSLKLDLEGIKRQSEEANDIIANIGRNSQQHTSNMASGFDNVRRAIAGAFTATAAVSFAQQVINVRTEIDSLERSFSSLLASPEKGSELMKWIKDFAATTPLTIQGLAKSAQTMIGFGIEADKVTTYLKALGDISMGDADRLQSLALAFSQMTASGKLMGQDLLQMINAGFNPLSEISRKTGESVGSLKARMNELPLEEVQAAFISATQEGGKFNNMLQSQAEGLAGVQATLRDAVNTELNNLGEKYEDAIKNGYKLAAKMVGNLDKVVPIVRDIIVAYGSYKAALITILAIEKALAVVNMSRIQHLRMLIAAQRRLNQVMSANKYAIIAGVIAGLVTTIMRLTVFTDRAREAQERLQKALKAVDERVRDQRSKAEELVHTIKDENETNSAREKAYNKLIEIYPDLLGNLDMEKLKTMELADAVKYLNEQRDLSEIGELEKQRKELEKQYAERDGGSNGEHVWRDFKNEVKDIFLPSVGEEERQIIRSQIKDVEKLIEKKQTDLKVSKLSVDEQVKFYEERSKKLKEQREDFEKNSIAILNKEGEKVTGANYDSLVKKRLEEYDKEIQETTTRLQNLQSNGDKVTAQLTDKERKKQADALKKQIERERKNRDEKIKAEREWEDIISDGIAAQIEAMKDGSEKKRAAMEEQHRLDLQQIEREKQDFINAKKDRGENVTNDDLKVFENMKENKNKAYAQDKETQRKVEREGNEKLLKEYEGYLQRRERLENEYTLKALDIQKKAKAEGVDAEPYLRNLQEEMGQALEQLDLQFAEKQDTFKAWAEMVSNMGLEALQLQLTKAKAELSKLRKEGSKDEKALAQALAKIATLQHKIGEEQAKGALEPKEGSLKRWQELYKTIDIASQGFEKIGESVGGVAGEILKETGQIASSTISMISGITTLVENSTNAMAATGKAGQKAMSTVEKASVILAIVSAGLQIAMKIASLFDQDKVHQKEIEALQGRIDQLQWELNNVQYLRMEAKGVDAMVNVEKALQKARGSAQALRREVENSIRQYGLLSGLMRTNQRLTNDAAKELVKTYAKLDYTIDKALGEDKFNAPKKEMDNIAQQTLLMEKELEAEKAKKKHRNEKRIAELENGIKENAEKINDKLNKALEDIMGGSAENLANQLGDALMNAFERGEDAAEAWHGKVKDIVKDIMKRMLISKLVEEPLGAILDKYKKQWYEENGDFKGINNVLASLPDLANEMDSAGGALVQALENLDPALKKLTSSTEGLTTNREASRKGIATASQDSVDELNGRATAIQGHTYSIAEQTKMLVGITNAILNHVAGIHSNTNRLEAIEKETKATRSAVEEITIKGIKVK